VLVGRGLPSGVVGEGVADHVGDVSRRYDHEILGLELLQDQL
jgi:hypothetical protein